MPRPANLPCQLFRQWKGRWQGQVPPPFPVLEAHGLVPSMTQGVGGHTPGRDKACRHTPQVGALLWGCRPVARHMCPTD